MTGRCIAAGFRAAIRRPGLSLLPWAWTFALASAATAPLWRWLHTSMALSPESDVLRERISVGALADLVTHAPGIAATIVTGATVLVLIALVSSAFLGGAILACVIEPDTGRPVVGRFFAGGGRFFGRFLRLWGLFALSTAVGAGAAAAAAGAATGRLAEGGWEPGSLVSTAITMAVAGVLVSVFLLAHDYARIRVVSRDERGMLRAWLGGLGFVLRHPVGAFGIGAVALAGWLVWAALAYQLPMAMGAATGGVVLAGFAVQQLVMLARTGTRVAQLSAAAAFFDATQPPAPVTSAAEAPAPHSEEPPPPPEGAPCPGGDAAVAGSAATPAPGTRATADAAHPEGE